MVGLWGALSIAGSERSCYCVACNFALDLFSAPNNSPHFTAVRLFLRFLCKEHGTPWATQTLNAESQ